MCLNFFIKTPRVQKMIRKNTDYCMHGSIIKVGLSSIEFFLSIISVCRYKIVRYKFPFFFLIEFNNKMFHIIFFSVNLHGKTCFSKVLIIIICGGYFNCVCIIKIVPMCARVRVPIFLQPIKATFTVFCIIYHRGCCFCLLDGQ